MQFTHCQKKTLSPYYVACKVNVDWGGGGNVPVKKKRTHQ